jgi:hypothetical protein
MPAKPRASAALSPKSPKRKVSVRKLKPPPVRAAWPASYLATIVQEIPLKCTVPDFVAKERKMFLRVYRVLANDTSDNSTSIFNTALQKRARAG